VLLRPSVVVWGLLAEFLLEQDTSAQAKTFAVSDTLSTESKPRIPTPNYIGMQIQSIVLLERQ
jgi:hypothetical protein